MKGLKVIHQYEVHLVFVFSITGSAQPKNHAKENVQHIKEIQRANRKKQAEAQSQEPVKAVYKPGKFDHVQSRVAQEVKVFFFNCFVQGYSTCFSSNMLKPTLVPEVFFHREETREERERSSERKPLVAGDANLTIML